MISVHVIILNIYRPVSWMNVVLKQRKNNKKVSLGSLHYYYSSIKTRNICMEKVLTRNHVQDPIVYSVSSLVTFLELFVELLWIRMRWRIRFGLNFILTFFWGLFMGIKATFMDVSFFVKIMTMKFLVTQKKIDRYESSSIHDVE